MNLIKPLLLVLILLNGKPLSSQVDLDFSEKLYTKIVLENIELLDSLGNNLGFIEPISELFYQRDTVTNCWVIPKEEFIDMEYWPYGISPVISAFEIDTATNLNQRELINFYNISYEETNRIYLFSINRKKLNSLDEFTEPIDIDAQVVNKNNCCWVLESIRYNEKSFHIDSCFSNFKLVISDEGKYEQSYGNEQKNCNCRVREGITENESYDLSMKDRVYHTLSLTSGEIRTNNSKLILSNNTMNRAIEFEYESKNGKLILKTINHYELTLKQIQRAVIDKK